MRRLCNPDGKTVTALELAAMAVLAVASWNNNTVLAMCVPAIPYGIIGRAAWRWWVGA